LGEAKDDTPIEEFLVKKAPTNNCLQKGGHCVKVDWSAVRWKMVNIVLALILCRVHLKMVDFFNKEEL
jgi:hypothetical protein